MQTTPLKQLIDYGRETCIAKNAFQNMCHPRKKAVERRITFPNIYFCLYLNSMPPLKQYNYVYVSVLSNNVFLLYFTRNKTANQ